MSKIGHTKGVRRRWNEEVVSIWQTIVLCVGNDWVLDNAHQSGVSGSTSTSIQYIQNTYHCLRKASVSLYAAIQTRLQPSQPFSFLSSWLILVLPLLLSMTLFANHPTILFVLLSVPTGLLL